MRKRRRQHRRQRRPSGRPAWAGRDRNRDLEWAIENLDFLWQGAQQGYQQHGRGVVAIDTRKRPLPTAGHPIAYLPQAVVEQEGDPDTMRMCREYNPVNEVVVILFKPHRRTSTYRIAIPTCFRCGHLLSGEFVFIGIEKQLETACLSCPRCGLRETPHPGGILKTCPRMQAIITRLARKHGLDLTAGTGHLRLEMEGFDPLVIEKINRHLVKVGHYYTHKGRQIADPEVVCYISRRGWIPIDVTLAIGGRRRYASVINEGETIIGVNPKDQADLAHFVNGTWARNIEVQGWLERGQKWEQPDPRGLEPPDWETLQQWLWEDSGCEAACEHACWVEPDGHCPHGKPSWFLKLGLI